MKRLRWLGVVLAVALLAMFALPVAASNPTVTITVSAQVVSITNSQATWTIGTVVVDDVKYFSADNNQDDNYSQVENTGNVAVDIQIQGTNFVDVGLTYNWTLAATAGNQTYSLYANANNGTSTYNIEVKSSAYNDLTTNLPADDIYVWSMNFTAPDEFNANDDGGTKTATVTLVASKHT